jgi:hypothetical protein
MNVEAHAIIDPIAQHAKFVEILEDENRLDEMFKAT